MFSDSGALFKVDLLMRRYIGANIVSRYQKVECSCGESYDPGDGSCICGNDISASSPTDEICYRVERQPQVPVFNQNSFPANPDIFISYRHADCEKLAADIYYFLRSEDKTVFLDNSNIPPGAEAENIFLRAAGRTKYFISLVSANYFGSLYCKKELAHAARCGVRLIRVNVPPYPPAPADMPWVDGPSWNPVQGDMDGLSTSLESSLLSAIQVQNSAETIANHKKDGCAFLMSQLSSNELLRVQTRLRFMDDFSPSNSKTENIRLILQEATGTNLDLLCNALSPT